MGRLCQGIIHVVKTPEKSILMECKSYGGFLSIRNFRDDDEAPVTSRPVLLVVPEYLCGIGSDPSQHYYSKRKVESSTTSADAAATTSQLQQDLAEELEAKKNDALYLEVR